MSDIQFAENHKPEFEELKWRDVRLTVKEIAPDMFVAIERLNPDDSYRLFRVRYPFGTQMFAEDGVCQIPNKKGQLIPLNDASVAQDIQDALGYRLFYLPMSLILSGQVNLFVEKTEHHINISNVYKQGFMTSLRSVLDPPSSYQARKLWRMTAGPRVPFMLPSISDAASFNRLKKYFNLKIDKPKDQKDHWKLFVEIANHKEFKQTWSTDLLFFSNKWLEPQDTDEWRLFHYALLQRGWAMSTYERNSVSVNNLWASFLATLRNKKATDYVLATVRHIIEASLGHAPLYQVAAGDDAEGPFNELTTVFLDIYGLEKYTPLIMVPDIYDYRSGEPAYIPLKMLSRNWPGKVDFLHTSLMSYAAEMQYVLNQFVEKTEKKIIDTQDTPFEELSHMQHDFYHIVGSESEGMISAGKIFEDSQRARQVAEKTHRSEIPVSRNNLFLSCGVKVSKKELQKN